MNLVYRRITEEVYEDENLVEIKSNDDEIKTLHRRIDLLQAEINEMKSLLVQPAKTTVSTVSTTPVKTRTVAACNQKPFKRFVYSNYEFQSTARYSGKVLFDISDVVRLSKLIDNVEKFPTMKLLKENVAPFMDNNTFTKLVYNYQEGFFKDYLSEYYNNIKFTICNNHICIDGMDTKLRPDEVWYIVNLVINSNNHYECVDNLVKQYSKTKPLFIKIITDFASDGRLSRLLHPPLKQVKIENNPEKRREMGLWMI